MKKVLLFLIVLALPGLLYAASMGVFFPDHPGQRYYNPTPYSFFDIYLYIHHADCYVTGIEYKLNTLCDPSHVFFWITEVFYPENMVETTGHPFEGHSITYWPALNGVTPGYNWLCTYKCITTDACCSSGGSLIDYIIKVVAHPDSGELRGTSSPDNDFFPISGMASALCLESGYITAVEVKSWGAIKSVFKK